MTRRVYAFALLVGVFGGYAGGGGIGGALLCGALCLAFVRAVELADR